MKRTELAHLLRSASHVAESDDVIVFGSQSILGSYDEDELPAPATASMEADIGFIDDEDRRKADAVEGAIGELSLFHQTYGYYAEGIHRDTAVLPEGWESRVVRWNLTSDHPARSRFLDKHDLAIAKLVAGREKDIRFVSALIDAGLLDIDTLTARETQLPHTVHRHVRGRVQNLLASYSA